MTNAKVLELFSRYRACKELEKWAKEHGGPLAEIWRDCERGDWLLWLAVRAKIGRRAVVTAACACARTALVHVLVGEERPRRAIETAEAWTRGEADRAAVRAAAHAAEDAAFAAYSADAYAAGYAASASAASAYTTASAASFAAASTADAAADVARDIHATTNDDGESANTQALADCAELVRAYISAATVETGMLKQQIPAARSVLQGL